MGNSDKKILIIDDEVDAVDAVEKILKRNNYRVLKAYDGEEGLRKTLRENPDLIILDIKMPKMDGFTFLQKIKTLGGGRKSSVMILSALDPLQDIFFMEGVKDFIRKPFSATLLLKRIEDHFRNPGKNTLLDSQI